MTFEEFKKRAANGTLIKPEPKPNYQSAIPETSNIISNSSTQPKSGFGKVLGKTVATPVAALGQLGTGVMQGLEGAMDFGTSIGVTGINSMRNQSIEGMQKDLQKLQKQGNFEAAARLQKVINQTKSDRDYSNKVAEDFIGKQWVQDYVGNSVDQFTEQYSYLPVKAGQIVKTVGNMLPSIANAGSIAKSLPQATTKLGQLATKGATMLPFMAQAAGSSTEQALNEGANLADATKYGLASGVLEGAIESISGGIGGSVGGKVLSSKLGKEAIERIAKNSLGKIALRLADAGIDVAGEGFEEVLSAAINPLIQRMTYDEKAELATSEEMMQSFIDGVLASLLVKGGQAGLSRVTNRNNANVQENEAQNQAQTQNIGQGNATLPTQAEMAQNANMNQIRDNTKLITQRDEQTLQSAKLAGMTDMDIQKAKELNDMLRSGTRLNFYDEKTIPQNVQADKAKIANGFYKDGTLWINKNSKNKVEQILGHELTHHLETTDSYTDLSNTILDSEVFYDFIAEKGYANVAEYKTKLKEMGYEDAQLDNELVARFVEEKMFTDQKSIDRLARQNTKLVEKIKNWISDLVVSFKGTAQEKELRRIENMYRKALDQARNVDTSLTDAQYSIAGIKGARNLRKNPTYSNIIEQYKNAKKLYKEGYDNTRLIEETGWYRDNKGNWKYEFSDEDMTLKENIKLDDKKVYALDRMLEHDILFEAYPQLRNYTVIFANIGNGNRAGIFAPAKIILLNPKYANTKATAEYELAHEIQHAIQVIEGFPGSTSKKNGGYAYYSSLGEIEARDVSERLRMLQNERNQFMPETAKENPVHEGMERYLQNRTESQRIQDEEYIQKQEAKEKIKEAIKSFFEKRGVGYDQDIEMDNNKNNTETQSTTNRVLHNENIENKRLAGKEPAFSMPETDNQGRTLSKEQQEFFKDSKVRDEKGNLISYYHGTQNGGFNTFEQGKQKGAGKALGEGFYFTQSKSQAQTYASTEESINKSRELLGLPKKEATPQVYEVYLNAKNPLYLSEYKGDLVDKADYIAEKYLNMDTKNDMYRPYKDYAESKLETAISMIDYIKSVSERSGKTTAEIFKDLGYDALVDGKFQTVVFEPNQIKNVDNTNPTSNPDIRYSMNPVDKKINKLIEKYGEVEKGEKAVRDVKLPKQVSKKKYLSKHAQTLAEAGITSDETVDQIKNMVAKGQLTHEVITDKKAQNYAEKTIKTKGWEEAIDLWNNIIDENITVDKNHLALGQMIYNQAVQNKDEVLVKKMIADLVNVSSETARTLQATRLLKKLTPDGRLYALEKSAMQINKEMLQRYGEKFKEIEIPNDLAKSLLNAKNQKEIDVAVENIQQYIADQVPPTLMEKLDAWRYLAMLGNPKTHIKNVLGNTVFYPVRGIKNALGTGIEKLAETTGLLNVQDATKAIKVDARAKKFAENDFDKIKDSVKGISKYDIGDAINDKRKIFNTKWLENARKGNSALLDLEDEFFLKQIYINSFAQAMKARGITVDQLRDSTAETNDKLNSIRNYAIKEAQKGTYRNVNALADFFNNSQRFIDNKLKNADNLLGKAGWGTAHILSKGALPFVKVPINIAQVGIEYSPASFATAIYKGLSNQFSKVESGKYSASEVIDDISKGLTGSALLAVGILLAKLGIVTGAGEDKDKERGFETLQGNQNYAIDLGGHSYTIDWAAPASLPFFVGVECVNGDDKDIFEKAAAIVDPLFELSMLKGIGDIISSAQYSKTNAVSSVLSTMAQNYTGQFIPSVLGQLARSTVSERRTTYKDKNSWVPTSMQNFGQKQLAKIPAANHLLPKYIDQWGNTDKESNVAVRLFENFLSPGYLSKNKTTETDEELKRLYDATEDIAVLPSKASKSFTVDKVKKELTAKEYEKYATVRGQKSYQYVTEIINSEMYDELDDTDKVKLIKSIYAYANEEAKEAVSEYEMTGSDVKIKNSNSSPSEWLLLKTVADSGGDKKDEKYNSLISAGYTQKQTEEFLTDYKGYKFENTSKNTLPTLKQQRAKLPTLKK